MRRHLKASLVFWAQSPCSACRRRLPGPARRRLRLVCASEPDPDFSSGYICGADATVHACLVVLHDEYRYLYQYQ